VFGFYRVMLVEPGAVLAQKFWGWGIAPICCFITESIFSVLRNRKNPNFICSVCQKMTPFWYLSFTLKITDRSFRHASPRLWNQLPDSTSYMIYLLQIRHFFLITSVYQFQHRSPLSPSIVTAALFHSRLKSKPFFSIKKTKVLVNQPHYHRFFSVFRFHKLLVFMS